MLFMIIVENYDTNSNYLYPEFYYLGFVEGHLFTVAVMRYLRQARGARCPVIGCSSVIVASALEKDEEMERALRRAQRNRQRT